MKRIGECKTSNGKITNLYEKDGKHYIKNPSEMEKFKKEIEENINIAKKKLKSIVLPKGWVREKSDWKEELAVFTTGGKWPAVRISLKIDYFDNKFLVSLSGIYLYENKSTNLTLEQAIDFTKRLMKYVNYGRYTLKVTNERFEEK